MEAGSEETPHPQRWFMLVCVSMVYFCFGVTSSAIASVVNRVTTDLDLSHMQMGSILGAWQFIYIGAAMPCGALLDKIGARRGLVVGALVVAASGILRGLAVDYLTLLLAVAAFGIGGPLVSVGVPTVVKQWFHGKERGFTMGLCFASSSLGQVFGLLVTPGIGLDLAEGNWRHILIAYGFFALAAALVCAIIGRHPAIRAYEAAHLAAPSAKTSQAGAFLELIRLPALRTVLYMAVGTFFFGHALGNWLPEILRLDGMDLATAGSWASLPVIVGVIGSLTFPRFATPARRMKILALLFAFQMIAPVLILIGTTPALVPGLILQGLARGTLSSVVVLVLMELREVDSKRMGAAGGMYFTAGEIGGVLGPFILGTLYDFTGGFTAGLVLLTVLCAWQLLLLTRLRNALR